MIFLWCHCCSPVRLTRTPLHTVFIIVIASPLMTGAPIPEPSALDTSRYLCHPCPPGTFMEDTCLPGKPDTATCVSCPEGTYRRKPNHAKSCHPHKTSCDAPYQIKEPVQPGDRTHDAMCHCEHGAVKVTNNQCVKRQKCPPGKGMTKGGQCKQCEEGTFSDRISKFQKCRPISNCTQEGKKTLHPGSVTSDAHCGELLTHKSFTDINKNQISADDMTKKQVDEMTTKERLQNIDKVDKEAPASERYWELPEETPTLSSGVPNIYTDSDSFTIAMKILQRLSKKGNVAIQDENGHMDILGQGFKVLPVTESYDLHTLDAQHFKLSALEEMVRTTKSPGFSETPADNAAKINLIIAITSVCLLGTAVCISLLVVVYRLLKMIVNKQKNLEATPLIEGRQVEGRDIGENTGYQEDIEDQPLLSQEPEPCTEPSSPHADLQEPPAGAEGVKEMDSSKKEVEVHPSTVPAAVVRPKQRSLTSQPQATSSEEDSLQYTGSADDETVPLLLRGSQDISSPMDPAFKTVALHPTPPLKEDADSHSSMTEDAAESSVPQQTLAEELQETEEQSTKDVPDGPSDAGPQSEPKELSTQEEDEEETSLKQISGPPEDSEHIPDIEEIARTAMVRVPSDELSFPVQESAHDSDGLEALGAVGGRSESFSPLPTSDVESDAESSSGDEAYERKVRVAIRDSVAKSLFTGLAHHLSNPAGPGPDWVPLARAAGITGPEIDHIINEAAQDLDKDIRKMLEQYEEGKTGDRPISELYGELIARKRLELYNKFRRDPPS